MCVIIATLTGEKAGSRMRAIDPCMLIRLTPMRTTVANSEAATVEYVAWGERESMIAEYGAFDPLTTGYITAEECRFLVLPIGNGQWDTEWCATRKEALELARGRASEEADYQERKVPVFGV